MDSLRLCLSCAGRKPSDAIGKRGRQRPTSGGHQVDKAVTSSSPPSSSASVSDDSLEKVLEQIATARDDQPDTPGYWRNHGIGDVDTPPVRRKAFLLPLPPPSTSSSNSIISVDSCRTYIYSFFYNLEHFLDFVLKRRDNRLTFT